MILEDSSKGAKSRGNGGQGFGPCIGNWSNVDQILKRFDCYAKVQGG